MLMVHFSRALVGVCAYNEENNIGNLLNNLISEQNMPENCKILVVCSGCSDRTPEIVRQFQAKDKRIDLIIEDKRTGKANALNMLFRIARRSFDVLVLVNADAVPKSNSIRTLVAKLESGRAGAVFAQPIPFGSLGVCYNVVGVIWHLHHMISLLQKPKLSGELCAIRVPCLREIPKNIATDEPYIEMEICKQGYEISYAPTAIVNIRCPTNISDLVKQRKRIWVGHMQLQNEEGFEVSTSNPWNIVRVAAALKLNEIPYLIMGGFLEVVAYVQAKLQISNGIIPYAWEPISSTKD